MLLVVLGHSLQHGDYDHRLGWNLIYSFHMPAFFFVSGYVCYSAQLRWSKVGRRAKSLLLPFVTWAVIVAVLSGDFVGCLTDIAIRPDNGYWFLYVLFVITLLFHSLDTAARSMRVRQEVVIGATAVALTIFMAVFNIRYLGMQFISYYFLYYALGFYARKYEWHWGLTATVVMVVAWAVGALFWHRHEIPSFMMNFPRIFPDAITINAYRYLIALLGIAAAVGVSVRVFGDKSAKNLMVKALCYVGNVSLGIYTIHLFIGDKITPRTGKS